MVNHKYVHSPFPAFVTFQLVVFLISKKKILLKKEKQEKYKEFTVVNKE